MTERQPFAHVGEHVTCERGHIVGVLRRALYPLEIMEAGAVQWAIDPAPRSGDPIRPCPLCPDLSYYVMGGPFNVHLNIEGEWRP